jgi:hypothetical protein
MSPRRAQAIPVIESEKLAVLARFAPNLASPTRRFVAAAGEERFHEGLTPDMLAFVVVVTRAGWLITFDWASWAQTAEGQRLLGEPRHVATATADQLAKVLTALIRAERFSEGTLNGAFENGLLLALARRAEALLDQPEAAATVKKLAIAEAQRAPRIIDTSD